MMHNHLLNPDGSRSTIGDVARLAGVSTKTVSRVTNNEPHVRTSTRERVERAIAKLDYQPNLYAQYLSSLRRRDSNASN